jgi:hypothetical protein
LDSGQRLFVGEVGPPVGGVNEGTPNLGARVGIYTLRNRLLVRLGGSLPGTAPGQFLAPHSIALDSQGSLYVGEVSWQYLGRHLKPPRELSSLQKMVRSKPGAPSQGA